MILDSFDNAEEDITARQVIEAKNEAGTILDAVAKGERTDAWKQLSAKEREAIAAAVTDLKSAVAGGDYKVIRVGIERLDKDVYKRQRRSGSRGRRRLAGCMTRTARW